MSTACRVLLLLGVLLLAPTAGPAAADGNKPVIALLPGVPAPAPL